MVNSYLRTILPVLYRLRGVHTTFIPVKNLNKILPNNFYLMIFIITITSKLRFWNTDKY